MRKDNAVNIFDLIIQGLVSGIAAFGGIYLGNRALDTYRKPTLGVDPNRRIVPALISRFVSYGERFYNTEFGSRGYYIPYMVNRMAIRNTGNSAAENSKGSL